MRSEVRKLPELFLERLQKIIPLHKWDEIANTFTESRPTTFRANTLKVDPKVLRERLEQQGFGLESAPWYRDAFILKRRTLRELQTETAYTQGEIYVQALSSMLPPLVLDPQPGEEILDLTAAPGSKTTQIAALMRGEGRIVANDNNRVRFFLLKSNLELQGVPNASLSLQYGESFGRKFPERFDRVLLDAPCSAEGRFQVRDPKTFRFWKPIKIKEMVRKQKKLLYSAIGSLKPGGTLVYSTCTFAPEENEGVLDWALRKFAGAVEMEPIQLPLTNQMLGLANWVGESYHQDIRKAVRILPTNLMEGFFVARLRKTTSILQEGADS